MNDFDRVRVGHWLVLGGTRLGVVVDPNARQGNARGVRVMDGGAYSRFVQDWCVKIAVVGRNVCPAPMDAGHSCGMLHVSLQEVEQCRSQ